MVLVLKGVNWVHNDKNQVIWSWKDSIVYTMVKLGQMVLYYVKVNSFSWIISLKS